MDFFDWTVLTTLAGCSAATTIVTQFIKLFNSKIHPQLLSYAVALIIMFCATILASGYDLYQITLIPLNALIVSFASNGEYDVLRKITN